jgi:hypothetical protein
MKSVGHENEVESQRRQTTYYDRNSRERSFKAGDQALVLFRLQVESLSHSGRGHM